MMQSPKITSLSHKVIVWTSAASKHQHRQILNALKLDVKQLNIFILNNIYCCPSKQAVKYKQRGLRCCSFEKPTWKTNLKTDKTKQQNDAHIKNSSKDNTTPMSRNVRIIVIFTVSELKIFLKTKTMGLTLHYFLHFMHFWVGIFLHCSYLLITIVM